EERAAARRERDEALRQRKLAREGQANAERARKEADKQRKRARAGEATARQERREADRQRARAQAHYHQALNLVDTLLTRMMDPRLEYVPGFAEERRQFVETALAFYREFLQEGGTDPDIRHATGRAYQWLGNLYVRLGKAKQAEES